MKWGDFDVKYSDNILCFEWYDNKAVLLLASNIDGIHVFYSSTSNERFVIKNPNKLSLSCEDICFLFLFIYYYYFIFLIKGCGSCTQSYKLLTFKWKL